MDANGRRPWRYKRDPDDAEYPYVVRAQGEPVCRVRSADDADAICLGRTTMLREAGRRASDLRRFSLQVRHMKQDIRLLVDALDEVGQVLKLVRPREIVRARETIRKVLRIMKNREYLR